MFFIIAHQKECWRDCISALLWAIICCSSATAWAGEPEESYSRSTLRLLGPVMGLEFGDTVPTEGMLGSFVLMGIEASHRYASGVGCEINYIMLSDASNHGHSFAFRTGYAPRIYRNRLIEFHLFPFLGYRYAERLDYDRDGYSDVHITHNVHGGVGYDLQLSRARSVVLRATFGVDGVVWSRYRKFYNTEFDPGRRSSTYSGFLHLSLGVAFTSTP